MNKILFIGFAFFLNANLQATAKEAFIPYYMRNTDSSKLNAIKTDNACGSCDCGDDSSSGNFESPFTSKQELVNLKNQNTQKLAKTVTAVIADKQA